MKAIEYAQGWGIVLDTGYGEELVTRPLTERERAKLPHRYQSAIDDPFLVFPTSGEAIIEARKHRGAVAVRIVIYSTPNPSNARAHCVIKQDGEPVLFDSITPKRFNF